MERDPEAPLGHGGDGIRVHSGNPLAGDHDISGHELQGLSWQEPFDGIRRSIRRGDAVRRIRVQPFCQEAGMVRLSRGLTQTARPRQSTSARKWAGRQRTGSGLRSGSARERNEERDSSSSQRNRGRERQKFQDYMVGHEPTLLTESPAGPLHFRPMRVGYQGAQPLSGPPKSSLLAAVLNRAGRFASLGLERTPCKGLP